MQTISAICAIFFVLLTVNFREGKNAGQYDNTNSVIYCTFFFVGVAYEVTTKIHKGELLNAEHNNFSCLAKTHLKWFGRFMLNIFICINQVEWKGRNK